MLAARAIADEARSAYAPWGVRLIFRRYSAAASPNLDVAAEAPALHLSEPAAADRRGIGFGWLQNVWLLHRLHARLEIHEGLAPLAANSTLGTLTPKY